MHAATLNHNGTGTTGDHKIRRAFECAVAGHQKIVLEAGGSTIQHIQRRRACSIAHDKILTIVDLRIPHRQRATIQREVATGIHHEVRRSQAATGQRKRAVIDRHIPQGTARTGQHPCPGTNLAQRAGATHRARKIRVHITEAQLHRVVAHIQPPVTSHCANRAIRREADCAAVVHRHRDGIGQRAHIRPIELAAGHAQIRALQ